MMLSHLSRIHNTPEKALPTAREGIELSMDEVEITITSYPDKDERRSGRIRV